MARRIVAATQQWVRDDTDRAAAWSLWLLTLVPMLLTSRGEVSADTKSYLTLDPGRLLSSARFMWDPSVGAGTVPHQNIGYLFPIGPYYWTLDAVGLPDWAAQRLLWALLVFAAAFGTFRLLRWLGWAVAGSLIAAVAYGFSPYLLSYLARLSAILFPWAALPWLILLAARAARDRSWFRAAQFALVVALVGSVNATSLLFVGLGPVIWLVADAVSRRVATRSVVAAAGRIGVLCAAVSAWWIAGLRVQGTYGLPILDFTESYQTVASASAPQELLRGLGYWFFYGGDRLDPWIGPAFPYFNEPVVMFVSFGLAGLSLLGLFAPFRGRASMLLLLLIGLVLSVGAAPLGSSTWYGVFFERFATDSTAGAALRSTPRAAPLLLLALACGLGAGVEAARRWLAARPAVSLRRIAPLLPAFAVGAVLVNLLPWFTGSAASSSLLRPETLPTATTNLAAYLNSGSSADSGGDGPDGRIFTIPGADFADYRWGGTVDPVLPGLTDRSVLYRELIPQGSAGTADLLNAFDRRLAEGWFEPATLEPIATMFGVETIVVRNDLQHERYRLARPGPLWSDVTSVLGRPDHAGPLTTDVTRITLIDEITLARQGAAEQYPITAAFELDEGNDLSSLNVRSASSPMILAGNGDGIVDVVAAGLFDADRPVVYAAGLDDGLRTAAASPWWVVTDTNRKQGHRWSSIGSNLGALEAADVLTFDDDPNDSRLDLFPDGSTELDDQTIAVHLGDVASVAASSYGGRIIYTAEDAPGFAIDGDPSTAWRAGIAEDSVGARWVVDFAVPEDLDVLRLLQPQLGANDRVITRIGVRTDTGSSEFDLDDSSWVDSGQSLDLLAAGLGGLTSRVEIEVLSDNLGDLASYVGRPGVGFAEVTPIRSDGSVVVDDRTVRLPVAAALGIAADDPLTYVLTRQRIEPSTPNRQAPEPAIDRLFDVPFDRSFVLTGQARLSATARDDVLTSVLIASEAPQRATATASVRLPGSAASRGDAAVDGDMTTAWQTPFDGTLGATLTIAQQTPIEANELTITWRSDGKHAAPQALTVTDGATAFEVAVPLTTSESGLSTVTIPVPTFTASNTTITLDAVSGETVPEYYSGVERSLPVGIAEVSFGPAASGAPLPAARVLSSGCRSDLISLDGAPLAVEVTGEVDGVLDITSCIDATFDLTAGQHRLVATDGKLTGLDLDRLVLDTAQRAAAPSSDGGVVITRTDATAIDASLTATDDTTLLMLPQSHNLGWTATVDGVDLGAPRLVDGYANGWLLPAGTSDRSLELRWTPQRSINVGQGISALAGFVILGLIAAGRVRRNRRPVVQVAADDEWPRAAPTLTPTALAAVAATTVVGFVLVGGPLAALTSAVVSLIVLVDRRTRLALVVAAGVVCVGWAAVSGLVIALEWRYDYANGPDWPLRFTWAAPVTWMVIAAVSTHVILSVLAPARLVLKDPKSPGPTPGEAPAASPGSGQHGG
jgi:arabinofuranan 3-O-arabinosyltransferase